MRLFDSSHGNYLSDSWVPPFGYPWITAYLRLPRAFRSLSRPSSAIGAMASTLRSYSLDPHMKLVERFTCFFMNVLLSFLCAVFKVRKVSVLSGLLLSGFAFALPLFRSLKTV